MYQLKSPDDTIVAISTATGEGGIGIVRLSGKEAVAIADKMFVTKSKTKPSQFKSFMVHYGWVVRDDEVVEEALLTVMRGPKSYTKDDVVEISCHGGMVPLKAILSLALDLGARLAEPGEFTKRAFLNGRIDLTQAEAVLDIIHAKTEAFLKVSHHQLKGELTTELETIRENLMDVYTEIEAIVNFPEDDIDAEGRKEITRNIESAQESVEKLLQTGQQGRILKEGIRIVLCGKPNVGKSSLLNAFLKEPRAIVTDVAGTTRDTIEETAHIKDIPFQLVDTAGILEPRDLVEKEAIKRSHMYIESADLVLFVLDASENISEEDENLAKNINGKKHLVVINKCDLKNKLNEQKVKKLFGSQKVLKVSALQKIGIEELEHTIVESVWQGDVSGTHGLLITNLRHLDSLRDCKESLVKATEGISGRLSLEFVSEEIKTAVNCLDGITGRNIDADLLDRIFSEFCVGK